MTNSSPSSISGSDSFGAGESNNGGVTEVLPVYKSLSVGSSTSVCLNGRRNLK